MLESKPPISTSECNLPWKSGLYRCSQGEVGPKKGKFGRWDMHTGRMSREDGGKIRVTLLLVQAKVCPRLPANLQKPVEIHERDCPSRTSEESSPAHT